MRKDKQLFCNINNIDQKSFVPVDTFKFYFSHATLPHNNVYTWLYFVTTKPELKKATNGHHNARTTLRMSYHAWRNSSHLLCFRE